MAREQEAAELDAPALLECTVQLATLSSLRLRRIGQTVEVPDTPAIRGMIHKVRHLVEVEES